MNKRWLNNFMLILLLIGMGFSLASNDLAGIEAPVYSITTC